MALDRQWQRLNALALLLAVIIFAALGLAWWRDRTRDYDTPRWLPARFVALVAETTTNASSDPSLATRERWLVAVNLRCPHCQRHLQALARLARDRASVPLVSALIVDQPTRPARDALGRSLSGGVWWDSAQVWRESWGRRVYGETFRFDAYGRMLSSTPAGMVPDTTSSRM